MPTSVDLELGLGAVGAHDLQKAAHGVEGVGEDIVLGAVQVVLLPGGLPILVLSGHVEQGEVQRARVQGRPARAPGWRRPGSGFSTGSPSFRGGGAQHDVATPLHLAGHLAVNLLVRVGQAGLGVAHMQMGHAPPASYTDMMSAISPPASPADKATWWGVDGAVTAAVMIACAPLPNCLSLGAKPGPAGQLGLEVFDHAGQVVARPPAPFLAGGGVVQLVVPRACNRPVISGSGGSSAGPRAPWPHRPDQLLGRVGRPEAVQL